jgi:hypothetical protein
VPWGGPVKPASVDRGRQVKPPSLGDGDLGHHLGLRTGDEDPPVDTHLETPEPPPAEHVLERLTGQAPFRHGRQPGGAAGGGRFGPPRPVEAADLLHEPAGLDSRHPGGEVGVEVTPRR